MSDTPKVHATLAALTTDDAPEQFVLAVTGSKRITFPDPGEMGWDEAETFLRDLASNKVSSKEALSRWLSPTDFKALTAEKLTYRQLRTLVTQVQRHYSDLFGTPGESTASQS